MSSRAIQLSLALAMAAMAAMALAACSGDDAAAAPRILEVPTTHASIQEAVDEARTGDLVLVHPGTYHEEVTIETPGITVRGVDRNDVVLDGEDGLANGIEVTVSGVAVENLTVRRYLFNGVLFNGVGDAYEEADLDSPTVDGFRVSHVTTANNGLYGVYAFSARNGTITDTYASGHPDSGIYIGQCKPCDITVERALLEHNAIGYYGTNASGGVHVIGSTFVGNRLGIAPNSQDTELLAPQVETVVAGNLVIGDGAELAPAIPQGFFGGGIAIGGGAKNTVIRNRVLNQPAYGIGLVALGPYEPTDNTVADNVLDGNAIDLLYDPDRTADAAGNCFERNDFSNSFPDRIEDVMACAGGRNGTLRPSSPDLPEPPDGVDHRDVPLPPRQPSMAEPRRIPDGIAGPPTAPDLDAIEVPATSTVP